jgi:hypothetical protein
MSLRLFWGIVVICGWSAVFRWFASVYLLDFWWVSGAGSAVSWREKRGQIVVKV